MRKYRNSLFYVGTVGFFSAMIYIIVLLGARLETGRDIVIKNSVNSHWTDFKQALAANLHHPLAILLAQIITIILTARLLGWLCKKVGQPSVIGEIVAGILLGPSLIGLYFPEFSTSLFPAESLGNLQFISQIGLILFMFIIGMELDMKVIRHKANDAVVISHASIIIPFSLGFGLAYFIYASFAPAGVPFTSFGLFIGIAMSVTAFPVLARIVQERGINKTRIGSIVITCAAADDITAWTLLAAIIAIVKAGSFVSSIYTIIMAVGYVLLMIFIVRPFLARVGKVHSSREKLSKPIVAIFFLTLIISSYITELIGIHALFGAFMAGSIMPDNARFRSIFIEKVEDVALVLLLPLFFVFTGLRTQIGLIDDPHLWAVTGFIVLIAVTGKFVGSALAARYVRQSWKDSLTIGALMNTRGLMELVILNIGYDLGVLSPQIFAMMVIMALVTTIMTGPALDLINWLFRSHPEYLPADEAMASSYKILVSFGNPETGRSLLRLANGLIRRQSSSTSVTVMHLSPSNELNQYNLVKYEKESFHPIFRESNELEQKITTLFKASNDIDTDIADTANKGGFDLLLIGHGQSIFVGSLLGRIFGFTTKLFSPDRLINQVTGKESLFDSSPLDERNRAIIAKTALPVGVLLDKNLQKTEKIFIPALTEKDPSLLKMAQKLIFNSDAHICIADPDGALARCAELTEFISTIELFTPGRIRKLEENDITAEFLQEQDLMLVSVSGWKKLLDLKTPWLKDSPSTLVVDNKR